MRRPSVVSSLGELDCVRWMDDECIALVGFTITAAE